MKENKPLEFHRPPLLRSPTFNRKQDDDTNVILKSVFNLRIEMPESPFPEDLEPTMHNSSKSKSP